MVRSPGSGFRRGVGLGAGCWRLGGLRGLLRIGRGFSQELGRGFCRRARRWSAAGDSSERRRAAGVSGGHCLPLPRRVRSGTAACGWLEGRRARGDRTAASEFGSVPCAWSDLRAKVLGFLQVRVDFRRARGRRRLSSGIRAGGCGQSGAGNPTGRGRGRGSSRRARRCEPGFGLGSGLIAESGSGGPGLQHCADAV
jgi:hypothetical protein